MMQYIIIGILAVAVIALCAYAVSLHRRAVKADVLDDVLLREQERNRFLESRLTETEGRLEQERQAAAEAKRTAEEARRASEESRQQIYRLQAQIDRENALEHDSDRLSKILSPLKERIELFNRSFADSKIKDAEARQSLREQLDRLMRVNENIGEEARNLITALRQNGKKQGDWGESVLKRILEQSGLTEGVNFILQQTRDESGSTLLSESGRMLRPDVTILFPDERKLIVDSKVSLTAYLRLQEATTPEEERIELKNHLASVRKHIDELASKNYQKAVKGAADYVLMFMPVEGAYIEASRGDRELWRYAYERKVVVVSPAHILSILQLVSQLWRQDSRSKNAEEIARKAGLLYDRFVSFGQSLLKVGSAIDVVQKSYDDAMRRLSGGSKSLTATAERLRMMGARATKRIPANLLDETLTDDAPEASAHKSRSLEEQAE